MDSANSSGETPVGIRPLSANTPDVPTAIKVGVNGIDSDTKLPAAGEDVTLVARGAQYDALINALLEIGTLTGVATPHLSVIAACANMVNQRITADGVAIRPVRLKSLSSSVIAGN